MRTVPEWIGATLDTPVPPRVRGRVFEKFNGTCQECTRKIMAGERWICDHRVAIVNGGENREKNLGPIHESCNKTKTAADVAEKSKVARNRAKHLGIRKPSTFACSRNSKYKRKITGEVVLR